MGFVAKLVLSHSEKSQKREVPVFCGCLDLRGKHLLYTVSVLLNFALLPAQTPMFCINTGNVFWWYWELVTGNSHLLGCWHWNSSAPTPTPPLSITSCLHPPTAVGGGDGDGQASASRGGVHHGYGYALLYGLKIQFLILSDCVCILMLLFKCCLSICRYICSLRRQVWWASISASAPPRRGRGSAGGFRCSHVPGRQQDRPHLPGWGSPFALLQAPEHRPPATLYSMVLFGFFFPRAV